MPNDVDYEKIWKDMREKLQNPPEKYNFGKDLTDNNCKKGLGNKVALYWEDSDGNEKKYTYWELRDLSNKFGNVLRNLGIKKGERIFFRMPNIPEYYICALGISKIGAVHIPSSTMFREKEIEYRIRDSGAVAVVVKDELLKEVENIKDNCPNLKHIIVIGDNQGKYLSYEELMANASRELEIEDTRADDIAFIAYTSGTTGDPKGVVHMQRYPLAYKYLIKYWHDYREDDVVACPSEIGWLLPVASTFLYALKAGVSVVFYREKGAFNPEKWFQLFEKYKITNFVGTPTIYRMFLTVKDAEKKYDLSSWRHATSAGEPLPPDTFYQVKERFGVELLDGIGMSEVMVNVHNISGMKIKPGSCGKPGPGIKIAVLNDDGTPTPVGEIGNLVIGRDHPGLMLEYWNKPEKTAEVFKSEEWFWGGDVVSVDKDGYFFFHGRADDVIKASGYRISPFEVESALLSHPAVHEAAAVESPDEIRGNVVKGFIVLKPGYEPSEELIKELQKHCKEVAAPYKYPRKIEFVESLPKTQSGKIKRKELRAKEFAKKK